MQQTSPPLSLQYFLPTMYDLPSEAPKDMGLPDEFHLLQAPLLRQTFRSQSYQPDEIFTVSDLNRYYDLYHPQWYKHHDWFAVVGCSRLYEQKDLRLNYVIWQEKITSLGAINVLSLGTEKEDLGRSLREVNQPPNKWTVYEQILRIPYYFVFNRYTDEFQAFGLMMTHYEPLPISGLGVWLQEIELGWGLWQGSCEGLERLWLHWHDHDNNWILTPAKATTKKADLATKQANLANQKAKRLAAKLRELEIESDDV